MCVVSMIADHYKDRFTTPFPARPIRQYGSPPVDWPAILQQLGQGQTVTRAEFDELKREVAEMTALLKKAKRYDEEHNEPDCEIEEKMAVLRKVAQLVGVDLAAALQPPPSA